MSNESKVTNLDMFCLELNKRAVAANSPMRVGYCGERISIINFQTGSRTELCGTDVEKRQQAIAAINETKGQFPTVTVQKTDTV